MGFRGASVWLGEGGKVILGFLLRVLVVLLLMGSAGSLRERETRELPCEKASLQYFRACFTTAAHRAKIRVCMMVQLLLLLTTSTVPVTGMLGACSRRYV